jgi:hypothetical protein
MQQNRVGISGIGHLPERDVQAFYLDRAIGRVGTRQRLA